MNIKRAFLVLAAALLLPGLAMAQDPSATFVVTFDFDDNNDVASTTAYISCDGGHPPTNDHTVVHGDTHTFVVEHPEESNDDELECRVWIDDVSGYTTEYECGNSDGKCEEFDNSDNNSDGPGCFFTEVENDDDNECNIDMDPDQGTLTVHKEWNVMGSIGDEVGIDFRARISACASRSKVVRGSTENSKGIWCAHGRVTGPGDDSVTFTLNARYTGDVISIRERAFDSVVEVDSSDCSDFTVFPGVDYDCTLVNTVFFEGIPTLNQYGLAIMALLMLGVGFVGFRRFV